MKFKTNQIISCLNVSQFGTFNPIYFERPLFLWKRMCIYFLLLLLFWAWLGAVCQSVHRRFPDGCGYTLPPLTFTYIKLRHTIVQPFYNCQTYFTCHQYIYYKTKYKPYNTFDEIICLWKYFVATISQYQNCKYEKFAFKLPTPCWLN